MVSVLGRLECHHIDPPNDYETKGFPLQLYRAKHIWLILQRHRGDMWLRFVEDDRRLQRRVQ